MHRFHVHRNNVYDPMHATMMRRRRICKKIAVLTIIFVVSFYISTLLFGDIRSPKMHLTELHRCPACYGVSVCPELYSDQISVETRHPWTNMIFNTKNVYYGQTKAKKKVVLKKLAHNSELKSFDDKLCEKFNLKSDCKPIELLSVDRSILTDRIQQLVHYNFTVPEVEPRHGLIMCPYSFSIFDFIKPLLSADEKSEHYQTDLINIYTMLSINPEPMMLQLIPKTQGWPVPLYVGVCGRVELVAHAGETLSNMKHVSWVRKLMIAKNLLDAAMGFTFKDERFRFYLMDWSMDNIVVNDKNEITFVDLEDVIVLDKRTQPTKDLPKWHKRYFRDDKEFVYTFSIENICKHQLSDHNIYGACFVLYGDEKPFLFPTPLSPLYEFHQLFRECVKGGDRLRSGTLLQHLLYNMIQMERSTNLVVRVIDEID